MAVITFIDFLTSRTTEKFTMREIFFIFLFSRITENEQYEMFIQRNERELGNVQKWWKKDLIWKILMQNAQLVKNFFFSISSFLNRKTKKGKRSFPNKNDKLGFLHLV
jgi:hypothetical protein